MSSQLSVTENNEKIKNELIRTNSALLRLTLLRQRKQGKVFYSYKAA